MKEFLSIVLFAFVATTCTTVDKKKPINSKSISTPTKEKKLVSRNTELVNPKKQLSVQQLDSIESYLVKRFFYKKKTTSIIDTIVYRDSSYIQFKFLKDTKMRFVPVNHFYLNPTSKKLYFYKPYNDSIIPVTDYNQHINHTSIFFWDKAYSEFRGQSLGEEVKIILKGDYVSVYDNEASQKSRLITQGILVKNKYTNQWIITNNYTDSLAKEVGGCTELPYILDFENKLFWLC